MTPKQNVSMAFASGVDTKTDEYQLAPGQLSILENASFNKLKAVAKRTGHEQVIADLTLTHGVGIGHYRGQTLTCDGSRLYRVQGSSHQDLGGVSVPFQLSQFPVISAPQVFNAATSASATYVCTAVEMQTGVQVIVQDPAGAPIHTYSFPGTSRPQMLYFSGMSKHVLGVRDAVNGVRLYVLDPTNKSYQTQWIDQNAQGQFSIWADSSHVYVAVALLHTVFLERFYVTNGILYPQDVVTETTALVDFPKLVTGCQLDSDKSLLVWIESNNVVFFALAQNGSLIQSKGGIFFATDLRNAAAVYDGTTAHIYLDVMQTDAWLLWHMAVRSDYKAIVSNTVIGSAASLAAKPFVTGGRVVVPAISRPEGQRRYLLLDGNSPQVLSRFDDLTLDAPAQGCLSTLSMVGTKTYLCQPLEANSGNTVAVGIADTALGVFYGQEIASGFYFLFGSRMHLFDGIRVSEVGFDLSPDRATLPTSTGSVHTYNYSVVWSWTDAQGLVHESSPSPLCTMQTATPIGTGGGHESVALKIPVYPLPTMKGDVQCRLYRTPDNGNASTLRLCAQYLTSNVLSAGQSTISHTDSMSDDLLIGSSAFGASLPTPNPVQLVVQRRRLVPPAPGSAILTYGGSLPLTARQFYVMTAVDAAGGETNPSKVLAPHPDGYTVGSYRSYSLNWSQHSTATKYRLYRADNEAGPFKFLKEFDASATSFVDDGTVAISDIVIPASNTSGSGSFPNVTPLEVPSQPTFTIDGAGSLNGNPTWRVTACNARGETMASCACGGVDAYATALVNQRVTASWNTVADATAYKVYRGDSPGQEGFIVTVLAPTTSYTDYGTIPAGAACPVSDTSADGSDSTGTYGYRVAARNETGVTLASTEVTLDLTASMTPCGVLVTWQTVPGATTYDLFGRTPSGEKLLVNTVETSWLDRYVLTPNGDLPVSNTTGPRPYSGGEFIYTYNGTVPNQPPPPTCFLAEHQRRLFGICSTNRKRIWYSQPSTKGYPLETNPLLYYLDLPEAYGDCVGVAGTQDKLAIFMANSILWTMGDGADELGQGGYAVPQFLTSDVGLKDPKSIVATPRGLCFRSAKGIYAMGLAMEGVTYLGAPAEDLWLSTDTVRASCLSALDNEVRWYLPGDRGTETARVIVWHYLVNQFSLHRILSFGVTDAKTNPITGLVEIVGPFGQVCRANRTSYTDVGTSYSRKIRTGWLALGEISGYGRLHRLMLLAKWLSAHNLEVTLEFDRETNSETVIIPAQSNIAPELFEINPKTHRCESVRITVTDDGAAASCSLSALTFAVSLKPGFKRLGAAQKFAAE